EGNNFLWLQADIIRTELRTELGSAEALYRWWPCAQQCYNWSIGVRYINLQERLRIFTDDDGLTVRDLAGNPDPTRQADYSVFTRNQILGGQVGFDWSHPLTCWMAASFSARGAWGVDFVDVDVKLRRGDKFRGFSGHRSETTFGHLYEAGLFLDWRLPKMECSKLRTGWNVLWLAHVSEAVDQVDFNLEHTTGRRKTEGNIFYHGPTIELQFLF